MSQWKLLLTIYKKEELFLDFNTCLGSSGVEQSPEKACVGGANPSRGTIICDLFACINFQNLITKHQLI